LDSRSDSTKGVRIQGFGIGFAKEEDDNNGDDDDITDGGQACSASDGKSKAGLVDIIV